MTGTTPKPPHDSSVLRWAFEQSPTLLMVFDTAGRLLRLNDAAVQTLGRPAEDAVGKRLTELLPGPEYEDAQRRIDKVVTTGDSDYAELTLRLPGETWAHDWAVSTFPLTDGGSGVRAVGMVVRDYAQLQGARERLELLNESRSRIGESLEVTGTARELADVTVPRFADVVAVDLFEAVLRGDQPDPVPAGPVLLHRAVHRSVRGADERTTAGLVHQYPGSSVAARCLATGRAELYDPAPADAVRQLIGVTPSGGRPRYSLIVAPVRARGTVLGLTWLLRDTTVRRAFTPDDLSVVENLLGRVAVCLDNARRYTRERGIALTLQRSMLPAAPPQHIAAETAMRYLPAGGGAGACGDWFDVIPLPGARVGLVVGDVVGHGVHASAAMGRLRTAVRTLADIDLPPDELLARLDAIVTHSGPDRCDSDDNSGQIPGDIGATCLYAVYDPVARTLAVSRAGHPPPVLVTPDGSAQIIDVPAGPPLGLGSLLFETTELALPDGSLLALFTDGLFEGRGLDPDERLDQLGHALAAPAASLEDLSDRVVKAMALETQADDIALLLARVQGLDRAQVASWDFRADPAVVAEARLRACRKLVDWGLEDAMFTTELVVSELVTNAITHASGPVRLRLIKDRSSLICEVSDSTSTAPQVRRARLSDEDGRGLMLVAQLTERWGTRNTSGGKTIWTEQPLTGD
ncbi:SpoIIE family protein phosphatase [Streptomyces sp. J2-1]|uniref:SpoIIE family protein phosphatase n=1 Tax=Streptomyces corallincola TaxID=2851888 RepID=UPI001C38EFF0|nr:SpoIIE family protein phosphatase [Streptomyces corallincola]MBV2353916.1 SpoIIE family protein phosphatase [Streptomyces corallincola]